MGADPGLVPTSSTAGSEYCRWSAVFAGEGYYYGSEPGPVARRAVRYHRQYRPRGGHALDAGCGEGQDLVFLAERGYVSTGVELTESGVEKAARLLRSRGLEAEVLAQDLAAYEPPRAFDLILAVNSLQFMGALGAACLQRLLAAVADGGVFGISLFAPPERETAEEQRARKIDGRTGGLWLVTLEELLEQFAGWQMLEAARLWQWNPHTNQPQPFVTLIARNVPATAPRLPLP